MADFRSARHAWLARQQLDVAMQRLAAIGAAAPDEWVGDIVALHCALDFVREDLDAIGGAW